MAAPVLERDRGLADFLYADLSATELVNRRSISIITLLLTYQCPAQCDHCVFESSPHNTATIDPAVARTLIEAAARQKPPPVLGFSGGEPFLQLRMLRELTNFAVPLRWSLAPRLVCDGRQGRRPRGAWVSRP